MALRPEDVRTLAAWLSPTYVVEAALAHSSDPVLGAAQAYREVRGLVRSYARFVAHRDGGALSGLGLARALRAMGYVGRRQPLHLAPYSGAWRPTAHAIWGDTPAPITGFVDVEVGTEDYARAVRAVLRVLARTLATYPRLNVAWLRGALYQRTTTEVMVNVELGPDDVRAIVVDPIRHDDEQLARAMRRALRGLVRASRHELHRVGEQLLREWLRAGFIASPAAAMVSPVGEVGVPRGLALLVPGNGIPLSLTIGELRDGKVTIGLVADHRALDASHCGLIYRALREEVKPCCA